MAYSRIALAPKMDALTTFHATSVPETTAAGKTDHQNTDKDFDDFEFEIDTLSIDEFYSEYNPKQVKCGLLGAGS